MTIKVSRCRFVYFVIKVTKTIRKMVLIDRAEQIPCNNWQDGKISSCQNSRTGRINVQLILTKVLLSLVIFYWI